MEILKADSNLALFWLNDSDAKWALAKLAWDAYGRSMQSPGFAAFGHNLEHSQLEAEVRNCLFPTNFGVEGGRPVVLEMDYINGRRVKARVYAVAFNAKERRKLYIFDIARFDDAHDPGSGKMLMEDLLQAYKTG